MELRTQQQSARHFCGIMPQFYDSISQKRFKIKERSTITKGLQ